MSTTDSYISRQNPAVHVRAWFAGSPQQSRTPEWVDTLHRPNFPFPVDSWRQDAYGRYLLVGPSHDTDFTGRWLVQGPAGDLSVVAPNEFKALFVPAPDPGAAVFAAAPRGHQVTHPLPLSEERVREIMLERGPWRPMAQFTDTRENWDPVAILCANGEVHAALWANGRYLGKKAGYERFIRFVNHSGSGLVPIGFATLSDLALTALRANSGEVTEAEVETGAQAIFEHWQFGREMAEKKPAWVQRGNSLKQEEARSFSRAALEAAARVRPQHQEADQ